MSEHIQCKIVIRDGVPFRETPRGEVYSITLLDCGDEIERLREVLERISQHCHQVRGGAPPHVWIPALVRNALEGVAVEQESHG